MILPSINKLLNYKINDRIKIAGTWVYGTGNAVTLANSRYGAFYPGSGNTGVEYYEDRNNFRMRAYHRLDFTWRVHNITTKENKRFKGDWILTVYNIYGRKNAFNRYIGIAGAVTTNQISIFNTAFVSLTHTFKFQ